MSFIYEPIPKSKWEFVESLRLRDEYGCLLLTRRRNKWFADVDRSYFRWVADDEREIFLIPLNSCEQYVLWSQNKFVYLKIAHHIEPEFHVNIINLEIYPEAQGREEEKVIVEILQEAFSSMGRDLIPVSLIPLEHLSFQPVEKSRKRDLVADRSYVQNIPISPDLVRLKCKPQIYKPEIEVMRTTGWFYKRFFVHLCQFISSVLSAGGAGGTIRSLRGAFKYWYIPPECKTRFPQNCPYCCIERQCKTAHRDRRQKNKFWRKPL